MRTLILCLLLALPASAAPPKDKERPTWFMLEVGAGPAFGSGFSEDPVGLGLRSAFGVGGGIGDIPLRFYLMFGLRWSHLWADSQTGFQVAELERDTVDVSGHLRIYWLIQRLRLRFDIGLGGSFLTSSTRLNDLELYSVEDDRFAVYLGGGLSYRLSRRFSVGVFVETAIPTSRPERDIIATTSGLNDDGGDMGWTSLTLDAAVHF